MFSVSRERPYKKGSLRMQTRDGGGVGADARLGKQKEGECGWNKQGEVRS